MITYVEPLTPEDWDSPPPYLFKVGGRWYADPSPVHAGIDFDDVFDFYGVRKADYQLLLLTNKHPALGREPGDIRGMYLWSLRPSDQPIDSERFYTDFGEGAYGFG